MFLLWACLLLSWVLCDSCCLYAPDKIFSVPIVPLTEENETAMEDPVFMDFLHGLGLSPPANEQVLCASLFHLSDAPLGLELSTMG